MLGFYVEPEDFIYFGNHACCGHQSNPMDIPYKLPNEIYV